MDGSRPFRKVVQEDMFADDYDKWSWAETEKKVKSPSPSSTSESPRPKKDDENSSSDAENNQSSRSSQKKPSSSSDRDESATPEPHRGFLNERIPSPYDNAVSLPGAPGGSEKNDFTLGGFNPAPQRSSHSSSRSPRSPSFGEFRRSASRSPKGRGRGDEESEKSRERKSPSAPKRPRAHKSRSRSREKRYSRGDKSRSRSPRRRYSPRRNKRSRSRDRFTDRDRKLQSRSHSHRSRSKEYRRSRSRSYERRGHRNRYRSSSRDRHYRRRHSRDRRSRSRSRDRSRGRSGSSHRKPGSLPLTTSGGAITPQMALQQTMAAMSAKAQALTGIALPKYYNPAAVNPLKYAEQVQKRKLLWQSKEKVEDQQKNTVWDKLTFAQDQDGKMTAKFRKLMGMKSETMEPVEEPSDKESVLKRQEVLFRDLDQQYEMARMTTHTQRGVGLGYSAQTLYPPVQK